MRFCCGISIVSRNGSLPTFIALLLISPAFPMSGSFTLERVGTDDWRAEYCFEKPVDALRFERGVDGLRETHWRAIGEEFELRTAKGTAVLSRVDGKRFECGKISVATWTHRPEKNYYAFSRFSDGGMSVYTGYFMGSVLVDGKWQSLSLSANYAGRDSEKVIANDLDELVEQFVYFGHQEVLEAGNIRAVVDPAMPEEARQNILDTIPVVNRVLAEEFKFQPASPYLIFMATELESFSGFSSKGGALRNQVIFTLKGTGVASYLENNPKYFAESTAHEIVHLWQMDRWQSLGDNEPWIHEGGADALGYEILRRAEVYDENEYLATWKQTEVECAAHLQDASIHSGPGTGNFDVTYKCGAIVNRLIGEVLSPADAGAGIIRLWQAMSEVSAKDESDVSEQLLFSTLNKVGLDAEEIAAIKDFLDVQTDEPLVVIARLRAVLDE